MRELESFLDPLPQMISWRVEMGDGFARVHAWSLLVDKRRGLFAVRYDEVVEAYYALAQIAGQRSYREWACTHEPASDEWKCDTGIIDSRVVFADPTFPEIPPATEDEAFWTTGAFEVPFAQVASLRFALCILAQGG